MLENQDDPNDLQIDHDPIEDDPEIGPLIAAATKEAIEALADHPSKGQLGFCHVLWEKKKDILKSKHGIDWKTPQEMDPFTLFD